MNPGQGRLSSIPVHFFTWVSQGLNLPPPIVDRCVVESTIGLGIGPEGHDAICPFRKSQRADPTKNLTHTVAQDRGEMELEC